MGERSDQVKSIFLEAIEEHAPEQWPGFLELACAGDVGLRAEVQKLLRAQAEMGSFHEAPPSALFDTADHPIPERPGTVIGAYKLLQQIGEGGMGVVYLAEQEKPVRRRVALKVIKPGMDTAQVIARFEAERQALALMDHPNIAQVLAAGATDSGHPYFVMELVKGGPITEFCDRNQLAPEARLKLFLDVCGAIQHAHHKGVIHRDIKPTNVLVTLRDGVPVVKVIDFGIAKATGQKLSERTLFTAQGQMIGTPAYMSPEQAEVSGLDIDTRSDVYALGVLLYELLTRTTPLEDKRLREAGYAELRRLIREEEAPRPSTRLSSLGDSATVLAGNRGLDGKRLRQLLAGELDWVVMKALEKDRNRRYDTPGSFAEDIERYLRREAILARPPSAAYRVKKFAQRNRAAALTGSAIAAALLVGTAVVTWQAARGLGLGVSLRRAVEAALPHVEKSFADQPLIEARLRQTLGLSFGYLGEWRTAAAQCEAARALFARHLGPGHPDTLTSMNNLANSYAALGRHADALQLREQTLTLLKARLGPGHPNTLMTMNNLAIGYAALGRHADASRLLEQTLALRKLRLGPGHPDTLTSMNNLANSYAALGRHADALQLREQTLALRKARLGPGHPDTLASMRGVAASLVALGRGAEAVPLIDDCVRRAAGKVVHPRLHPGVMDLRLRHLEKTRGAAGGRQTAERWEGLKRTEAGSLYNAACMRAVTAAVFRAADPSPACSEQADAEADRAMAWLKQAVAAGYKTAAHLKQDKDLDALRDREDFTKLVTALEGTRD
jgi:serine/threonine-protein kinase